MKELFEKVESVKCVTCGDFHDINSDTFVSFVGNVMIGTNGGIVGNNLIEQQGNNMVVKVTTYCRNARCLSDVIAAITNSPKKLYRGDEGSYR